MVSKILGIIISRAITKSVRLAAILSTAILTSSAESHAPRFPEINLIRGTTAAGHPYLNGGISSDEQRVMKRADGPYNLKLVFATQLGTPVTPEFVVVGANDRRHIEKIALRAPWVFIQLPPGGYTVLTRFKRDIVLVRNVNITNERVSAYFLRGE